MLDQMWLKVNPTHVQIYSFLRPYIGESETESEGSPLPDIDPEDPMRDFLIAKFKEEKEKTKRKSKKDRVNETPEEKRARKERKRAKKAAREARERGAATGSSSRGFSRRDHDADRDRNQGRGGSYRDKGYDDRESRKRPRSRSPALRTSSGRDSRRYDSMR